GERQGPRRLGREQLTLHGRDNVPSKPADWLGIFERNQPIFYSGCAIASGDDTVFYEDVSLRDRYRRVPALNWLSQDDDGEVCPALGYDVQENIALSCLGDGVDHLHPGRYQELLLLEDYFQVSMRPHDSR